MVQPKILLIDDEKDFIDKVSNFLEKNNFRINSCSNAEESYRFLQNEFFDVVICDVLMPFFGFKEGGIEISKIVAEKYPASFTIIISQYVTDSLVDKFMESIPSKRYRFLSKGEEFENRLLELIRKGTEKKYIFVCMPFHEDFEEIYEFGIKKRLLILVLSVRGLMKSKLLKV